MFVDEDALGQQIRGVAVLDRHRLLNHDRTAIEPIIHQVNGAAGDLDPMLEGLALDFQPGKRR